MNVFFETQKLKCKNVICCFFKVFAGNLYFETQAKQDFVFQNYLRQKLKLLSFIKVLSLNVVSYCYLRFFLGGV